MIPSVRVTDFVAQSIFFLIFRLYTRGYEKALGKGFGGAEFMMEGGSAIDAVADDDCCSEETGPFP